MLRFAPILVGLTLLCGCTDLTCGEGTHEEQGICLPNILTACGEGTYYQNGRCLVDFDALISDTETPDATSDTDEDTDRDGQDDG